MIEAATPAAVPAEGGAISIDYEVKNPVEGKRLSAQSDDAWVKELTVGDEAVTARLEKNLLADPRTATGIPYHQRMGAHELYLFCYLFVTAD